MYIHLPDTAGVRPVPGHASARQEGGHGFIEQEVVLLHKNVTRAQLRLDFWTISDLFCKNTGPEKATTLTFSFTSKLSVTDETKKLRGYFLKVWSHCHVFLVSKLSNILSCEHVTVGRPIQYLDPCLPQSCPSNMSRMWFFIVLLKHS